ncbi:Putative CENPB DNA-binding domain-containing protein 1 [Anthophora plagiata]
MFNQRSITRRKRKSMSLDMKMRILNQLEKGEKPTAIAKAYGINESTVRTIKKRKESIRSSVASGTLSSSQCSSYTRNPVIENMEKALMIWMDDNMQKKIPMNSLMIREKAVHIFNRLKEQASSIDKMDTFSASKGWFQNFKKRYSLRNLKFKGESFKASKKYNILNCVKNIALALSDVKHSTLNVCWKAIWPQVVIPDNTVPTTEEGISNIITSSQRFEKEGFGNLNECDVNDLLVDGDLIDIDLIHITSETQPNDECNSDYEEADSFTAENLCKALELAKKLESVIVYNDPNIQRALKFRQDLMKCCSEYQQIYENLIKEKIKNKSSEKININNENDVELRNISSDEDDTFVPIKKKRLIVLNYSSDSDIE